MKCLECKGEKGLCADGDEGTSTDCTESHCVHMTLELTGIHRSCNTKDLNLNLKKVDNGCSKLEAEEEDVSM